MSAPINNANLFPGYQYSFDKVKDYALINRVDCYFNYNNTGVAPLQRPYYFPKNSGAFI